MREKKKIFGFLNLLLLLLLLSSHAKKYARAKKNQFFFSQDKFGSFIGLARFAAKREGKNEKSAFGGLSEPKEKEEEMPEKERICSLGWALRRREGDVWANSVLQIRRRNTVRKGTQRKTSVALF